MAAAFGKSDDTSEMDGPTAAPVPDALERGWSQLPSEYRIPDRAPSLQEARGYVKRLAESHYENFHVATWLLPRRFRPHFHAIYGYCRISDDLGDEVGDREAALALLDQWERELDACYRGEPRHPVFVALRETILACNIPREPFADLLQAFRQDQRVTRYRSMEELLGYCRNSANPVGRLVLYACGYCDAERFQLSDATCSALQLANFWQDVRVDLGKGRIYLPLDDMEMFGVDEESIRKGIAAGSAPAEFRSLLRREVDYTRSMFEEGLPLIGMVSKDLAMDLDLFSRGGLEILRTIEALDYDVLARRPVISKPRKLRLLLRALTARLAPGLGGRLASRQEPARRPQA